MSVATLKEFCDIVGSQIDVAKKFGHSPQYISSVLKKQTPVFVEYNEETLEIKGAFFKKPWGVKNGKS